MPGTASFVEPLAGLAKAALAVLAIAISAALATTCLQNSRRVPVLVIEDGSF
jgi:hypothetical protein